MGVHTWIYKKLSSFTKDELYDRIILLKNSFIKDNAFLLNKEKYAQWLYESSKPYIKSLTDSSVYKEAIKEFGSIKACKKRWEKYRANLNTLYELIHKFEETGDNSIYLQIHDIVPDDFIVIHKGEEYLSKRGDLFRCYIAHEEYIDNLEELLTFLLKCEDAVTYKNKNGVSDELLNLLEELFKNNDIIIHFI